MAWKIGILIIIVLGLLYGGYVAYAEFQFNKRVFTATEIADIKKGLSFTPTQAKLLGSILGNKIPTLDLAKRTQKEFLNDYVKITTLLGGELDYKACFGSKKECNLFRIIRKRALDKL